MEQKSVAESEEFMLKMKEFPTKVITITKYPGKSVRSKQDLYGWTRCPTEEEQQVMELWEEEFQKANDDGEHDLNLYKSVIESELETITESKGNDGQNVKHGQDKLGAENGRNEPKGNGTKDDETVNIGKSKDRTIL